MPLRKISIAIACLFVPVFAWLFWHASTPTLTTSLSQYQKAGEQVKASLSSLPALPIQEEDERYTIEDTTKDGIQITYTNQSDTALAATPDQEKPSLTLHFPKKYATDPIEVQITEGKSILIQDKTAKGDYTTQSLSLGRETPQREESSNGSSWLQSLLRGRTSKSDQESQSYLSYTDSTKRITSYYAYGHDQATGEKQLKNWQVYNNPSIMKGEQVAYSFTNAKLKKNEDGTIGVYYYGDQELQNDKASAEVDPSLMARAQRTLAKDMGDSIDAGTATPNFIIPKPYYIDSQGNQKDLDWRLSMDGKDISIDFTPEASEYPLALDPTLSFTAPAMSNTGDVITGATAGDQFGSAIAVGDFNADGKTDLAVGANTYSSNLGRVYIFYQDALIPSNANVADVIITGTIASGKFGGTLLAGDFNSDGKDDLVVGTPGGLAGVGGVYIFYNDGNYPLLATGADVAITPTYAAAGSLTKWDANNDGKPDLVVGAALNATVYVLYNDGSIPTTFGAADLTITGATLFGAAFAVGDFDSNGKDDLAVGDQNFVGPPTNGGAVYIFYNDGSIPTTAATADVAIIAGNAYAGVGNALAAGDFNSDGRTDLAVGAYNESKVYIFYNDGSYPATTASADVTITGSAYLGYSFAVGDFNGDGRTDLATCAFQYASGNYTGRIYIFYNDGSIPTAEANADVIITGEAANSYFGRFMVAGDLNGDGRIDLAVGAYNYASATGRAYIFYSQNGQVNTNQNITGNATSDNFGQAMTTGDFNADGRTDLAVGAPNYSTNTGRVYLFYGDGQIPTTAATADVTITGEATNNYFGYSMTAGDLNADGKTDLIVGAYGYSTNTGRAYIFYNDGSIPTTAATADVTITGETTNNYFGSALMTSDFNADGKTDVVIGAYGYSSSAGRAYIFYNDGSIPTTAATADVTISGGSNALVGATTEFASAFAIGDFNADGRTDIVIDSHSSGGGVGCVHIFYNDGSYPTTESAADLRICSGTSYSFGFAMTGAVDFNSDGKNDLAVAEKNTNSYRGRVYVYYNDGSIPTGYATPDLTLSGNSANGYFGYSLTAGDFNADGKTDLAVGAYGVSTNTGQTYIFYSDGSIPTSDTTADVIITGETTSNYYGAALTTGDFNNDGRSDLVVGAYGNATNTGKVYFYETRENFAWKLQSLSPDTGGLRTGLSGTGQEMKITGNAASDQFGFAMTTGDFNSDGKADLAVGAIGYSTNTGRVYIFYGDGSLSTGASGADVVITGEATNNYFGFSLISGDFNADGRIDLAVGALYYSSVTGRAYIFYNDGSYPTTAATADVIITGEGVNSRFGVSLIAGDFNSDGRTDLASSASYYLSGNNTGRVYIFYNDGASFGTVVCTTGCLAANADIIITGAGTGHVFGYAMTAGDLNVDGRTDLIVGAYGANNTYIFYNDGVSFGTTVCTTDCLAANADVIIGGQVSSDLFGIAMTTGDFNADGKTDLAVGASYNGFATGKTYIFYADGTNNFGTATCSGTPAACSAVNADVIISGESNSDFGNAITTGDFNADGRTDLAVGGYATHGSTIGKAYIFYNDGSIPTTATTADVILTGESASNYFGYALTAGDLNADGKTDLVVGAYGYSGSRGCTYIYTFNDPVITGETTNNSFGASLVSGDFNADGKIDLAVGASGYSTNTGRVYLFYQDGTIPATAASADVIITGEATNNYFGSAMTAGDFNADGKTDLVVGAYGYSTNTGRAYIFYNDGSIPTTAVTADVTIASEGGSFGAALAAGDLNSDGTTDLVVGAYQYSSSAGRVYIFYNDGSIPTTAATADVIITDASTFDHFGQALAVGDFNTDGRIDLAVGLPRASGGAFVGYVEIFYNDGSYSNTPDVTIAGEGANNAFGYSLSAGDFNSDGRIDLAVGAYMYSTNNGRAYIFYNDGSIPTTAATADVTLTGETTNNYFGWALTSGDFNADGRTDLVVGAYGYSTNTGRSYIFYNDGSYPTTAATADVMLTGETTNNYFGYSLTSGDWNADGKIDLAVGAYGYSTSTGRVYLFTSEAKADSAPSATARVRGVGKLRGTSTLR